MPILCPDARRSGMPRPPHPSPRDRAVQLLEDAQDSGLSDTEAAAIRQEASVHALLAVADAVSGAREAIADVAGALKSQSSDAGTSLHYISEWLETIASRRR
jgi:hypothetical protein